MTRYGAWSLAAALLLAAATGEGAQPDAQEQVLLQFAAERLEGPVSAHVERVIDGDTIAVRARIWLGQTLNVSVRINGVDAPELHGRCAAEREAAVVARDFLERRIGGAEVRLSGILYDKYGGRVVAAVSDAAGDIGEALIAAGHARPYAGGARAPWCEAA